ncbi:hypothetical protein J2X20_005899 [Pelomonas saccharophila]|uniref:TonB-dependent receptor n=1 Tax=Roseateles saccharophilus TaxID=304 RepID=A0ABU1YWF4_ROSSA|nr:TonB-dependent receptor [Roseateles saccharophilus]MDR7273209.1 hypothetical protein [Roseateles saccharophilus]
MVSKLLPCVSACLLICAAGRVHAEDAAADAESATPPKLESVEITGRHYENGVGTSDAASQGVVRAELLKSRPVLRPGEVLEFVPGLIVTQHSGDGKANQYFLRGFNLDHGTDFATTVMGFPVNMPSHAHGQGYSDLNFLIPELVERIDYRKGPYFARNGDFAAAGSADIDYRRRLDGPFTAVTIGDDRYRRGLAAGSTELASGAQLLAALEVMGNAGPWKAPEDLDRRNLVLTLSGESGGERWRVGLLSYRGHWTSTDQVPERLLEAGTYQGRPFGRFDTVDASDGGNTRRTSLSGEWSRDAEGTSTRVSAHAMSYGLTLFSNFTYALDRPDTGDQFLQRDDRRVYGLNASQAVEHQLAGLSARSEVGLQVRQDRISVGLFDTERRSIVGTVRNDSVRETQVGLFGQTGIELNNWARAIFGLRVDQARFVVGSRVQAANSGAGIATLYSPKWSLVLGPWARTELFFNAGRGFHSNDARGVTARIDPRTSDPIESVPGLAKARGSELGVRTEFIPGLQSSLALWRLAFDSELVYVGDAGTTEASLPSKRRGIEWNMRYLPTSWLLFDVDLAWTHARYVGAVPGQDRLPNAVDKVASIGVTLRDLGPWSASWQYRYLGSAALVEDNSVRSHPSLTTNLRVARRFGPKTEVTFDVFNVLNRKTNDIEYYYESRLAGESAPVADRHIHPAEPRALRVTLRRDF